MWVMDYQVFGDPIYGLNQTQGAQFLKGIGEVGRGEYRTLNSTGALPINISWQWPASVFQQFVAAWQDPSELRFGAKWFEFKAPLFINYNRTVADLDADMEIPYFLGIQPATDGVIVGYSAVGTEILDSKIFNPLMLGDQIVELSIRADQSPAADVVFATANRDILPYNSVATMTLYRTTGEKVEVTLSWNEVTEQYEGTLDTTPAGSGELLVQDWVAASTSGDSVSASLGLFVESVQNYKAHFQGPYSATAIGTNWWQVDCVLEIEATAGKSFE